MMNAIVKLGKAGSISALSLIFGTSSQILSPFHFPISSGRVHKACVRCREGSSRLCRNGIQDVPHRCQNAFGQPLWSHCEPIRASSWRFRSANFSCILLEQSFRLCHGDCRYGRSWVRSLHRRKEPSDATQSSMWNKGSMYGVTYFPCRDCCACTSSLFIILPIVRCLVQIMGKVWRIQEWRFHQWECHSIKTKKSCCYEEEGSINCK